MTVRHHITSRVLLFVAVFGVAGTAAANLSPAACCPPSADCPSEEPSHHSCPAFTTATSCCQAVPPVEPVRFSVESVLLSSGAVAPLICHVLPVQGAFYRARFIPVIKPDPIFRL